MRGVAYQNMGEAAKAKMDFARADKLGYKPEEEKESDCWGHARYQQPPAVSK